MHKTKIDSNDVPPGALVSFVQKGLQYLELEANLAAEVQILPRHTRSIWLCVTHAS